MSVSININNLQTLDGGTQCEAVNEVITQIENLNKMTPPKIGTMGDYAQLYDKVTQYNVLKEQQLTILDNDIKCIISYANTLTEFSQVLNMLSLNLDIKDVSTGINVEALSKAITTINEFYLNVNELNSKITNFDNLTKNNQIDILMDNVNKLKEKITIINQNVEEINSQDLEVEQCVLTSSNPSCSNSCSNSCSSSNSSSISTFDTNECGTQMKSSNTPNISNTSIISDINETSSYTNKSHHKGSRSKRIKKKIKYYFSVIKKKIVEKFYNSINSFEIFKSIYVIKILFKLVNKIKSKIIRTLKLKKIKKFKNLENSQTS